MKNAPLQRKSIDNMKHLDETPLTVRLLRADLRPDPTNRKERNPAVLQDMADSMLIRQLQPCLVWEPPGADGLQIAVGEGRWLAAGINEERLGVPQYLDCVILYDVTAAQVKGMQIVENLHRDTPTPHQFAVAVRELLDLGMYSTHEEVAQATGVSAATISVYLKVLAGPESITNLVREGIATMDTAQSLIEVAKTNPDKSAELVAQGEKDGKLKRETVRAALSEEKAKAPAKLGKVKEAAEDTGTLATKPPAPVPGPVTVTVNQAPQAAAATPPAPVQPGAAPADKALIPAAAVRILVMIVSDSPDADAFHEKATKHGIATLADDVVHSDHNRAWIRFGVGSGNDELMSVSCMDLEINKIVARG